MELVIDKATAKNKKYKAVLYDNNKKVKTSNFGASRMSDYTIHKDDDRKDRYIQRHEGKEKSLWSHNKSNLMIPAYLSRYLLWNKPTLTSSAKDISNRLNVKVILK